ncbi:tumor necrosis factor alpha-induced protein 2-like isoform X2 [Colossoma macropomum]|uniref:tumor necrosis factor alpha-induced protein 2-like isoform X2 n=1 Tax=Colossoma macropomum TaxID=42526 RepID=UPI0018654228|nr:tumor necrosis factor alpha-induced protein 2-like isoform X2 [Colossoma macropomum]
MDRKGAQPPGISPSPEISMASSNLPKGKQTTSSPSQDNNEASAEPDAPDYDVSPPPQITAASSNLLDANQTPHAPPQENAEMPLKAKDSKSSRAVRDSSCTAKAEQMAKSLKGPEEASPKSKKKTAQQKMTQFVQLFKPKPTPDTLPEDNEMSGAVGGSTGTATVEQTSKASGSSEVASPTVKPKKKRQVPLDFKQKLKQNCLAEASQQLLEQEDGLFRSESAKVVRTEDEEKLKMDYETLESRIWMVVRKSLNGMNQETLESAVTAILQEEEQDQRWKEAAGKGCPSWRPMKYREMHDMLLQKVVKNRMQQVDEEEHGPETLKREVCQMSNLIQNDMFQVVTNVQGCYPPEFDICNVYAQLYHQVFSAKLRQLPRHNIPIEECIFILKQVSNYSNNVLHHEKLESHIDSEALEPLLPAEDLKLLEEQYLSYKENKVNTWLSNILKLEEESGKMNKTTENTDRHLCSPALDVKQIVDEAMKEAMVLLSNRDKAQRILYLLPNFLTGYKKSIEELLKNQQNITEILKAHLFGIKELRDYIEERDNLPDDVKAAWLSTAADIRDSCHKYFLSCIHNNLKVTYSKLWTPDWILQHHEIIQELEDQLNQNIRPLKDLNSACLQELLSQLHFEVMIEYVRRMLKRKLKLKNKDEQETAAGFLCEDSFRINTLFIENGSDKRWLCEILPKVSEVLKEQDSDTLELEICALLKDHPDLTEQQVHSILQLRSNISCADKRMIKECYHQSKTNINNSDPAPPFFCRVPQSCSLNVYSCFCICPFSDMNGKLQCKNSCHSVGASSPV